MDLIIDFYKSLDTINLIVFWGIIIVLILLLVFAIVLSNKNKKLKAMLNIEKVQNSDEIPVKQVLTDEEEPVKETIIVKEEPQETIPKEEIEPEIEEKNDFIAEEYVMEYNKDLFSLPNIKKAEPYEENKEYNKPEPVKTGAYQKNILRELSSNQTSPIGITKKEKEDNIEKTKAIELYNTFNDFETEKTSDTLNIESSSQTKEIENHQNNKQKYIKDVSQKLAKAVNKDEINRTEYEIKQEADAIISYDELMRKKDTINIVDEEEAVISIDELIQKKQDEKLYNITAEEENDEFISELKDFRNDL